MPSELRTPPLWLLILHQKLELCAVGREELGVGKGSLSCPLPWAQQWRESFLFQEEGKVISNERDIWDKEHVIDELLVPGWPEVRKPLGADMGSQVSFFSGSQFPK